ncbi:hypothetical protein TorRG33x02_278980, partial [Trema orientale]
MSPKLDRYTTSYLLSGYAFNAFKLRNHVDSRSQEDSDDNSLCPKEGPVTAIDEQQLLSHVVVRMEESRLMDDKSHYHSSDYDIIGAHGLGLNATNQKQGAHGLVREEARVSSFKDHGVHGLIGEAARVFGGVVQQTAADIHMHGDASGLGLAKRGYTTIDSSMVGVSRDTLLTSSNDQGNENVFKGPQEEHTKYHFRGKDSSFIHESTNDSLNTSDLSPTKVFASKDEGWQEVQSKKKKKAAQAQFTRPITRSSK